jgi:hypothetical protein
MGRRGAAGDKNAGLRVVVDDAFPAWVLSQTMLIVLLMTTIP